MKKNAKPMALVLALTMAASMVLAGCGSSSSQETAAAAASAAETEETAAEVSSDTQAETEAAASSGDYADEIHIVLSSAPSHLDVVMTTEDDAARVAQGSIFEQLVTIDTNYQPVMELAESYEVDDESTEYTYHLRQGVYFHNGEEMKADDVVASMNRWIDAASNAQDMVGDARFETVDDYTVKITMDTPCEYLNLLIGGLGNRAAIMPKSVIDAADPATGIVKEYIGTGPYKFDTWEPDQYIRLVKYDDYQPYGTPGDYDGWGGYKYGYTPTVYFDIVTDDATVIAGLQTGEYDVALDINYDNLAMFMNDDNFQVLTTVGDEAMLVFNKKEGLASDPLIRQAVQAIINCDDIMLAAYANPEYYEIYSSYMYKEQTDWYTEAGSEYFNVQDYDRANELLEEAGYDGTPFRLLVSSDTDDFYKMAIVLKSQLDAAGLPCDILAYDWATFVDIRNNEPESYDGFITSFSTKVVPSMNLYLSSGWAGWCDDERIESDLISINTDTSKDHAIETWVDLQQYMYEESVPVCKFGTCLSFLICKKDFEDMGYFERALFINAKLHE